jgi:rod shape-determining protein MreC
MLKRPHYIALGLVGLLTLIALNLPTRLTGQFKLAIGGFFLPLVGLSRAAHQLGQQTAGTLTPRSELLKEIESLRRSNEELRIQAAQVEALRQENDRLRLAVGWQRQIPGRPRLARVILHDPANWWETMQIDLGSRDGMVTDLPVISADGLVGRISRVGLTSSVVSLVGSSQCKVSAILDKTRETGVIVRNDGPLNRTLVILSYLSSNAGLKPGQSVLTSGMGGIFPAGILIGQVAEEAHPVDFGLNVEVRVKLAARLDTLDEVWVLAP